MIFRLKRALLGPSPLHARLGLLRQRRYHYDGLPLDVFPGVFDPHLTLVGEWMALQLRPAPGERWLELGCGSGLISLCLARHGAAVTAVDLDPRAVQNTRHNARLWGLPLELHQGDLFAPLPPTRYHTLVANLPFWEGEPDGRLWSVAMRAGTDFSLLRRFSREFQDFAPRALLGLSEAGGHWRGAEAALGSPRLLRRQRVHGEWLRLVELRR
ncbi:MAG TPA: methyltransferase [Myxococcota bacterium]|nr:methyltransferase [Myxococcota bacterium]